MTVLNVRTLEQVPEFLSFAKESFPTIEVKGIICSSSKRESVLRELQSRKSRRFVVILCIVWIIQSEFRISVERK